MGEDQMIWEPYDVTRLLSCRSCNMASSVPLICFALVEYHYPDRVLRQFGMRQLPPRDYIREDGHGFDLRGRINTDWKKFHETRIDAWTNGLDAIQEAEPFCGKISHDNPYITWYRRITRLYMCPVHIPSQGFLPSAATTRLMLGTLAVHI